jgi:predicted transposase YdaD
VGRADISSKHILAGDPTDWVRWLLDDPLAQVEESLSAEFRFILRHSDELFRVRGQEGTFVLLVEVQLKVDARMPRRMRAYAALAEERYGVPAHPVVFYLLPPAAGTRLPTMYHSEFMGLTAHQDFRVVPVWEMKARQVLADEIVALAPFVPLMRGAGEETIQASVRLLREQEVGEEAEVALALFASFVMEPEQIRQLVRWDMAVLRESPWYNQILEEGLQEGVLDGHRQDIVHLLRVRFDPVGPRLATIADRLARIKDAERLQALLVEAARSATLEGFLEHLDGVE